MIFKKLIVITTIIGFAWGLAVNAPKINAGAAVVNDPINAAFNATTAGSATSLTVKEYVLDAIARTIARSLLNIAVSGIINKIQTGGRDGGPAFVQNWSNFQTNAQYRGENVFRSILASTNLCSYTSGSIKELFAANTVVPSQGQNLRTGNFDSFALRSNCTMPSNFSMTNYQNDFSGNGGWNAWSRMLEPQNNYYGLLFGSLDESARQRSLAQSSDVYEAMAGSGYTSVRNSCTGKGPNAQCVFMGQIFTPGDLLGKSAASTIDNDLGWLVSSDELSEVIIAIGSAITNRIINLATSNPSNDYATAPKTDTSSSDKYLACVNSCPAADNITCQTNCARAWGYNVPQASSSPPSAPPGGGGTGVCRNSGGNPDYAGALRTATDAVLATNSGGIADALNTTANGFTILNLISTKLRETGFNATTNVKNGNDNPNTGDLIAVWKSGDTTIERYDAITDSGAGSTPLRNVMTTQFTGDIPLSCTQ